MTPAERENTILRKMLKVETSEEAAFLAVFGLKPPEARILGKLYHADGRAVSVRRLAGDGCASSVPVYLSRIRERSGLTIDPAFPVSGRAYRLTPSDRSRCDSAINQALRGVA